MMMGIYHKKVTNAGTQVGGTTKSDPKQAMMKGDKRRTQRLEADSTSCLTCPI